MSAHVTEHLGLAAAGALDPAESAAVAGHGPIVAEAPKVSIAVRPRAFSTRFCVAVNPEGPLVPT